GGIAQLVRRIPTYSREGHWFEPSISHRNTRYTAGVFIYRPCPDKLADLSAEFPETRLQHFVSILLVSLYKFGLKFRLSIRTSLLNSDLLGLIFGGEP